MSVPNCPATHSRLQGAKSNNEPGVQPVRAIRLAFYRQASSCLRSLRYTVVPPAPNVAAGLTPPLRPSPKPTRNTSGIFTLPSRIC